MPLGKPLKAELAQLWREFHAEFREIKARNVGLDPEDVQRIVDEAVREVRAERASRVRWRTQQVNTTER